MKSIVFIFLLLSSINTIFPEGLVVGTRVKMPRGYKAIEEIQEGDYVVSFDNYVLCSRVKSVLKKTVNKVIRINIGEENIFVAEDQQILLPSNEWIKAGELTNNHYIWSFFNPSTLIDEIEVIEGETEVYSISIEGNGQFFASEQAIMVYNFTLDRIKDTTKEEAGKVGRMAENAAVQVGVEEGLKAAGKFALSLLSRGLL